MSQKNRVYCAIVSLGVIFLLLLQPLKAQYNFQELEKIIELSKKELGKEYSILIYKDGKIVFSKSAGEFNPKTQAPIASASKWLTAALIMALVDDGKISLDDKLSKYIPDMNKYSKGFITIRHCLSHLTGIASEPIRLSDIIRRSRYSSLEEEITEFVTKREIVANPGLEFRYSNVGLNLAGRYIELALRRGFEQIMQEKILRPLQMRSTNFSSLNAINPSGGAQSTANDYINFCSMLLNKGMFNGKRILSESSVQYLLQAHTTSSMIKYAPKVAEGYNYAAGSWVIQTDVNGNPSVLASPGLFGTWPMIDLCRNYAVVFFAKELMSEDRRDVYLNLKKKIDEQIASNCQ